MPRLPLLLLFLAACAPSDEAPPPEQPATPAAVFSTEEVIEAIRAEYGRIQAGLNDLETTSVEYDDPPFGGEINAWLEDGTVVRLVDEVFNDHGPIVTEYYLLDGALFFAFERIETVEMLENPDTHVVETRTYLSGGRVALQLVKQGTFAHGQAVATDALPNVESTLDADEASRIGESLTTEVQRLVSMLTD